jgi:hypothetical protein
MYKKYLDLPRFDHKETGVIHPSPIRKKPQSVVRTPDLFFESKQKYMTGYLEEERKKNRLEGMASELVNPPKDIAAIKAAEREYQHRILEASGKLPKSTLSRG